MDRFESKIPARRSMCMNSENLKSAREAISQLSEEEKSVLLQEEFTGLGHQVILGGGNFITADVVVQIQSGDVDLSEVFRAAANRISKDKPVE